MFVIERNGSAWLCSTAIKAFEVDAVQLRIQGDIKNFAVFQQRLDNFEILDIGVIKVYKCSEVSKCSECIKYKCCKILQAVQETAQAHNEWVKWVEDSGGYVF